jgi:hypothetical protein
MLADSLINVVDHWNLRVQIGVISLFNRVMHLLFTEEEGIEFQS